MGTVVNLVTDFILWLLQFLGAPAFANPFMFETMAEIAEISSSMPIPKPSFTCAKKDESGRRQPQAIAHRGFKSRYPENTMAAFKAAIDIGVDALETDVHLTRDGVVVLSHDPTMRRCFGINKRIIECDWKDISDARTIAEPHEPMPRLEDLLRYIAEPERRHIWVLLDIKIDNDAETIMRMMADAVKRVPATPGTRWEDRLLLGCWATKYLPLCQRYFPDFPITNIGFSIVYARQFFSVPNASFNLLIYSLVSPCGRRFIRSAKARNREVYAWTVNTIENMDWCIRAELDGVITDDPKKFLDVRAGFLRSSNHIQFSYRMIFTFLRINVFCWIVELIFFIKYGFGMQRRSSRPL